MRDYAMVAQTLPLWILILQGDKAQVQISWLLCLGLKPYLSDTLQFKCG